jgi:hypothetical protein
MRKFKAQDFVTIKNVSDRPVYWQYIPLEGEQESFSEDGMQKHITRQTPEMWYIPAGETEVLVGESAYLCLDVMYKQIAVDSTTKKFRDPTSPLFDANGQHLPKNFNFSDSGLQDDVIKAAYLGKATPVFESYVPVAEGNKTTQPQISPEIPNPSSDDQIKTPTTAPNGQPAPEIDTGSSRTWPAPAASTTTYAEPDIETPVKELSNAGSTKR